MVHLVQKKLISFHCESDRYQHYYLHSKGFRTFLCHSYYILVFALYSEFDFKLLNVLTFFDFDSHEIANELNPSLCFQVSALAQERALPPTLLSINTRLNQISFTFNKPHALLFF